MASTLDYYNENAKAYFLSTVDCKMDKAISAFLKEINKESALLLDFGCGSGRDSKVFLDKGFDVVPIDGSAEMCQEAERFLSHPVKHMFFIDLDEKDVYDGIWACASILHLPYDKLKRVISKMERALKKDGVIYASFRYGEMEGLRGDRYFTDMNEEKLQDLISHTNLSVVKTWISNDIRLDRAGDKWLNILLKKI